MSRVYIVSAKRTAIGSFLGSLKSVHPADFGADVVRNIVKETKIDARSIDELIVGNILSAGVGQGIGRQVSIKAGIPVTVPAYSLNMVCGSGMKAIMNAYSNIKAGIHNLVIVGGTESMSRAPYLMPEKTRDGIKMGEIKVKDHMIQDALTDAFNDVHMGVTAENIAEKYSLSRNDQDAFAINSQMKAILAIDGGKFKDEIVPIVVKTRRDDFVFDKDEYPHIELLILKS